MTNSMDDPLDAIAGATSHPPQQTNDDGDRRPRTRRRLLETLGFGWSRNVGVGVHVGDDAIRLAAVDVPRRLCLAVLERRLSQGDVVRGEIRRPEAVARQVRLIHDSFGFPTRSPLTVVVEADISAVASPPPPGSTSAPVVTQTGRELGDARIRNATVSWLNETFASITGTAPRVEPAATALLRLFAEHANGEPVFTIGHCSGGRRTDIVLDVTAFDRSRRAVAVEATTSVTDQCGTWLGAHPHTLDLFADGDAIEARAVVSAAIAERTHDFASAVGAALAANGDFVCDFTAPAATSCPAADNPPSGWVLQRI